MIIEILDGLKKAVSEYDTEAAQRWATKAIEKGVNPIEAVQAMTEAIREVGDRYGCGDLFLPDLIGAANAMQSAMPMIDEDMRRKNIKKESLGTVVVGTVCGDVHNIGKNMVSTLLTAEGFTVHDLGVDVTASEFMHGVVRHSTDILAMSALMTTTAPELQKVIDMLRKEGLKDKVKVIVGGAAVTQKFADGIGADGYDPTAPGGAKLAARLVGR